MFHPATLLLAWAAFAFALAFLPAAVLGVVLIPVLVLSVLLAPQRTLALLKRARWLLLSIALLFAFATPGLLVPGLPGTLGMTQDGLLLAGEHLARLLLLLATLALLHERLGTEGFVSGLYWLLAPLGGRWGGLRERIVVRLMLVVEYVETDRRGWKSWLAETNDEGPQELHLAVRPAHWQDRMAVLLLGIAVAALAW